MSDPVGVQVFVGPANQLEIGTVTEGPTAVTIETVSDRLQRLNFTISAPTAEVLAAAEAAQAAAEAAAGAVTDEQLDAAVLRVITPATLLIDTDGRPYFA
jgi:hypothetical protein